MARIRSLALATALILLLPAAVALAAPGDLDGSFGGDGIVDLDWGGDDFATDVLVQPDGRVAAVGSGGAGEDFVVARMTPFGSPDPGFLSGGFASFALSGHDEASAVARQGDGKIVAAGFSVPPGQPVQGVIARVNADGTTDGSFSGDGVAPLGVGGPVEAATDVLIQPDGKIVAVGYGGPGNDWVIARLTPDGLPDASFTGNGATTWDFGGTDYAEAVALQPDGKLVVLGYTADGGLWVARFNADGSPDASFDGDGRRPLEPFTGDFAYDVLVQPDGKIVLIGGATGDGFLVSRLTPGGSFDESFGNGEGITSISFGSSDSDYPGGAVLQANGKIVVAGYSATGASRLIAVARLQPGGALDTTFSSDGQQTLPGTSAFSVALQPDGRIVVAGDNGADALVARLEGDGLRAGGGPPGGGSGGGGGGGGGGRGVAQVPRCAGKRATIVGSTRPDRLKGTRRADVIVALGGNDKISAGNGNDVICAGDGNDTIAGGTGNDRLYGQNGKDKLGGGSGKDKLDGGGGKDRLSGGGGRDSCAGGSGKDSGSCERGRL